MYKNYFSIVSLIFLYSLNVSSQFNDTIESYPLGPLFNNRWTTWNGNNNFENAIVTNEISASGTKSIFVGEGGTNAQDIILDFEGVAITGIWNASWLMYIPSGQSAYLGVQGNTNPNAAAHNQLPAGHLFFNEDNASPGQGYNENFLLGDFPFTFPHDDWFFVGVQINLDTQKYNWNINGVFLGELDYAAAADRFDGINFLAYENTNTYYVDNVVFGLGPLVIDTTPPIANCVSSFSISLDENGFASIDVEAINNGSTDNSGVVSLSIDISTFDCSNIGSNTVVLTVTDPSGNTDTCTTNVVVIDDISPTVNCPTAFTVLASKGGFYEVEDFYSLGIITATDNCTQSLLVTQTPSQGTMLPIGSYTVEISAEDDFENVSQCGFELIVEDPLNIDEFNATSFGIYPNPVINCFFIANSSKFELSRIEIFNLQGKKILLKENLNVNEPIDISKLESSIYFLKVLTSNNKTFIQKLIKK
ncbi:MAG: T9SS type A sorting domain-containing protein [Flavobacteriaceae bacterium]